MALTKIQLSELLGVYGELLTEKQKETLSMYCDCDCSLAEIADETGISRQGVRDVIVKGEATLVRLEDKLHLAKLYRDISVAIEKEDKETVFAIAKSFISKE